MKKLLKADVANLALLCSLSAPKLVKGGRCATLRLLDGGILGGLKGFLDD